MLKITASALVVVLGMSQQASAAVDWAKSGGSNVCAGVDQLTSDPTVHFATADNVNELTASSKDMTVTSSDGFGICDLATYGTTSAQRIAFPASSSTTTCSTVSSGNTIAGQPNCEFAAAQSGIFKGDTNTGMRASAAYYISTGEGDCSTSTNTFFMPASPGGTCETSSAYCISGTGSSCPVVAFKNTAIKFSAFLKNEANSPLSGSCSISHFVGRFLFNIANAGTDATMTFNADKKTIDQVVNTEIDSMNVTFGGGTSIEFVFPKPFTYGSGTGSGITKTGVADLKVRAVKKNANEVYIDYVVPVGYLNVLNNWIAYDPKITGTESGSASATVSSMFVVAALAVIGSFIYN